MEDLSWNRLDTLAETDPLKLRDIAFGLASGIADQIETMHGALENGPWVGIPDPDLRGLVSRYVADTVAILAREIGADDVVNAAGQLRRPGRLPISLAADEVP